jgi:thiamine biosynthesis lipoprotein ApbE
MTSARQRIAHAATIALLGVAVPADARAAASPNSPPAVRFASDASPLAFHHEGVLGTSMELIVPGATRVDAAACERVVLDEIERLRRILSTYDPASEIRRLMASGVAAASPELGELLATYDLWCGRTGGAIDANMGAVIGLWKRAGGTDRVPADAELRAAFGAERAYNVDALGKGFIIDRAVAVARRVAPAGLLNIGGDVRAWGDAAFTVGVADPARPAENSPSLATISLRDAAVATSGSYARGFAVAGRRYSHLIDPRTLRPAADGGRAATVVAPDCVTANALATAACVLEPADAADLADRYGTGHWIMSGEAASPAGSPAPTACAAPAAPANATAWPANYEVSLAVTFKVPRGGKVRRPYLAVWVQDAKGKTVRTVTVWGKQEKYLREMTGWWQVVRGDRKLIQSVTRATRDAGKYTIAWDGLDDAGAPVPKGDYTVFVEIDREHGRHVGERVKITCGDKPTTSLIKTTAESDEGAVTYGPKGK